MVRVSQFWQFRIFTIYTCCCVNMSNSGKVVFEIFKTPILFSLLHNHLPFKKNYTFYFNNLEPLFYKDALYLVWSSGSWEKVKNVKKFTDKWWTDRQADRLRDNMQSGTLTWTFGSGELKRLIISPFIWGRWTWGVWR